MDILERFRSEFRRHARRHGRNALLDLIFRVSRDGKVLTPIPRVKARRMLRLGTAVICCEKPLIIIRAWQSLPDATGQDNKKPAHRSWICAGSGGGAPPAG